MWIAPYYFLQKSILEAKIHERSEWILSFNAVWTAMVYVNKNGECCSPFISHRRSNDVGEKCLSLSLCAFHAEDSLFEEKRLAQFTLLALRNLISHSPFYLFSCELRLFICYWLRYCGNVLAVSLGSFALLLKVKLTCDNGAPCPLDPCHPLNKAKFLQN